MEHLFDRIRRLIYPGMLLAAGGMSFLMMFSDPKSPAKIGAGEIYEDEAARRRAVKTGAVQRMGKRERAATPIPFRDLLISMARMAERKV